VCTVMSLGAASCTSGAATPSTSTEPTTPSAAAETAASPAASPTADTTIITSPCTAKVPFGHEFFAEEVLTVGEVQEVVRTRVTLVMDSPTTLVMQTEHARRPARLCWARADGESVVEYFVGPSGEFGIVCRMSGMTATPDLPPRCM